VNSYMHSVLFLILIIELIFDNFENLIKTLISLTLEAARAHRAFKGVLVNMSLDMSFQIVRLGKLLQTNL
jgi:hypothetical protein